MSYVHGIGTVSAIGREPASLGVERAGLTRSHAFDILELQDTPFVQGDLEETAARDAFRMAFEASRAALADAGVDPAFEEVSLVVSTGAGDTAALEAGLDNCRPYDLARRLAEELGLSGRFMTVTTACASASYGASAALDLMADGASTVLLCGVEAKSDTSQYTFKSLMALDPDGCRPFAEARKGTVLGAGAAALVLREAPSDYGRISAVTLTCDGYHDTAPDPDGHALRRAMCEALQQSGCTPTEIDLFVPHATGTQLNDEIERGLLDEVFGEAALPDRMILLKGDIGHTCGASSAFSMVAAARRLQSGAAHAAFIGANAFGGNNACLVMHKSDEVPA
ncbi:MAG: beta-ketoacyl synthase N-terminal-like domain-containing protein [Pseudomonadota bacterium]